MKFLQHTKFYRQLFMHFCEVCIQGMAEEGDHTLTARMWLRKQQMLANRKTYREWIENPK